MEYVYSANEGLVLNEVGGGRVMMRRGDVWRADDPFVLNRPDLFSSVPTVLHSTTGQPQLEAMAVGARPVADAPKRGRGRG